MNILKETIRQLDKEEKRVFKVYASRFNLHDERKDIALFDLYSRNNDQSDDEVFARLYGSEKDKNAYYRLKNRLLEEINKTLVIDNVNEIKAINSHYFICLYHYFLQKNNFELAAYYLKRAEKQAREFEQYDLLDIIYGEFIKVSRELLTINPEEFIRKRKDNWETLNSIRQIDEVLSVLSYRLKITQNLGSKESPVLDIYEKTIREFSNNRSITPTPQFRIRVYKALSQLLIQRKDYEHLEPYLVQSYQEFSRDGLFTRNTHDTKVEMLIYLVNTLNELRKYEQAILYLDTLYGSLMEFNKLLYNKYLYFYYQAKVASYSRIDTDKAIETLQEMLRSKEISQNPFYQILTYSNLAFLQFTKRDFHACIKSLNRVYINDFYPKVDVTLKVKLTVQELMARYELGDMDVMEYRLEQVKRDMGQEWTNYQGREKALVGIIETMVNDVNYGKNKSFRKIAEKFIQQDSVNSTELMDYNGWLREKIKNI